jgi:hypothetical protein
MFRFVCQPFFQTFLKKVLGLEGDHPGALFAVSHLGEPFPLMSDHVIMGFGSGSEHFINALPSESAVASPFDAEHFLSLSGVWDFPFPFYGLIIT